ncbi:hypothetical protein K432DRAFT_409483 [Lepidopterella palustris CBS 459.81]|uniref:Uncharacterized protein n=1 Tax=Lepidopterella palustris CBS 459.81 TaxID=1314670 RepID=A0A8E2JAK9_9PEZI|nr:hypothetical protein K432DRAFT_409483 [Lepidopterella palustris CBS 459.81]
MGGKCKLGNIIGQEPAARSWASATNILRILRATVNVNATNCRGQTFMILLDPAGFKPSIATNVNAAVDFISLVYELEERRFDFAHRDHEGRNCMSLLVAHPNFRIELLRLLFIFISLDRTLYEDFRSALSPEYEFDGPAVQFKKMKNPAGEHRHGRNEMHRSPINPKEYFRGARFWSPTNLIGRQQARQENARRTRVLALIGTRSVVNNFDLHGHMS